MSAPKATVPFRPSTGVIPASTSNGTALDRHAAEKISFPPAGMKLQAADGFAFEQCPLALDAPAVSRQGAVGAHDPMARNGHGQRIGQPPHALPHGPRSARRSAAPFRNNSRFGRPESRAAPARRAAGMRFRARRAAGRVRVPASRPGRRRCATRPSNSASPPIRLGARKPILQVAHQGLRIVSEQDGADTMVAGRHQDRAERTLADGEADGSCRDRRRGSGVGVMPSKAAAWP